MVTITNGEKSFRVTAGAAKTFENMGFHIATDEELMEMREQMMSGWGDIKDVGRSEKNVNTATNYKLGEDKSTGMSKENSIFIEELLEKPLSQWTNEEVKSFVNIKGIDTSGAQKVSQVRSIIKAYLEEQSKSM